MRECKLHLDLPVSRNDVESSLPPELEASPSRVFRGDRNAHLGLHPVRKEGSRHVTLTIPHNDWLKLRTLAAKKNMPVSKLILSWVAGKLRESKRSE